MVGYFKIINSVSFFVNLCYLDVYLPWIVTMRGLNLLNCNKVSDFVRFGSVLRFF